MRTNIQSVSNSYLCSSCGACSAVCSKGAIEFNYSEIGRKYATVNENCIKCGKCVKVCPSIDFLNLRSRHVDNYKGQIISSFIGVATESIIFKNSQSGGVATAILKYLFNNRKIDAALVCVQEIGNPPIVKGVLIEDTCQLAFSQKSKYTPVDLLSALSKSTKYKSIAIVGLPCHIQGATMLKEQFTKFDNIKYKIGLICDRVFCNGIYDYMRREYCDIPYLIEWRRKNFYTNKGEYYSYENAPLVIDNKRNTPCVVDRNVRLALKEMFTAPRCRVCYDKLNTYSDITLGDPWGLEHDKEKGESLIIVRTEIGLEVICGAITENCINVKKVNNLDSILKGQDIEGRRRSVYLYSKAFKVLEKSADIPCEPYNMSKLQYIWELRKAQQSLILFKKRDNKGKDDLYMEAKGEVDSYNEHLNKKESIFRTLKLKIKRFIYG